MVAKRMKTHQRFYEEKKFLFAFDSTDKGGKKKNKGVITGGGGGGLLDKRWIQKIACQGE